MILGWLGPRIVPPPVFHLGEHHCVDYNSNHLDDGPWAAGLVFEELSCWQTLPYQRLEDLYRQLVDVLASGSAPRHFEATFTHDLYETTTAEVYAVIYEPTMRLRVIRRESGEPVEEWTVWASSLAQEATEVRRLPLSRYIFRADHEDDTWFQWVKRTRTR